MRILTNCNEIAYEVTTVVNMFFSKEDEGTVDASSIKEDNQFVAHCVISYQDKSYIGDFVYPKEVLAQKFEEKRFLCAAAAQAVCAAAKKAVFPKEVSLPWGLMLGIRPAKLVHEYVARGFTYDAALNRLSTIYGLGEDKGELLKTVAINENKLIQAVPPNSVSLYVGIPFCPTRCLYCSFVSTDMRNSQKYMAEYVDHLEREIAYLGKLLKETGKTVQCVYIGGGTPTSLSPKDLERVLSALCMSFDLSHMTEFTVEAGRPDTITEEKLRAMMAFPVNRISVNPQTMHEATLELIGRRHTVEDVYHAYDLVRKHTNFSVNMDLIAGLPAEGTNVFCQSLDKIIAMSNLSQSLLMAITKSLIDVFSYLFEKQTFTHIVIAGGVASCDFVREELGKYVSDRGKQVLFAGREYSSDNAAGIAVLAMQRSRDDGR